MDARDDAKHRINLCWPNNDNGKVLCHVDVRIKVINVMISCYFSQDRVERWLDQKSKQDEVYILVIF